MENLDRADKAILQALQQDARISNVELAEKVHLSPPAVHARLKRLEKSGLIKAYVTLLDREQAGLDQLCFISITLQLHQFKQLTQTLDAITRLPEVLECFHVTGEADYMLKVLVKNTKALEQFIVNQLSVLPGLAQIRTTMVLNEVKSSTQISLD